MPEATVVHVITQLELGGAQEITLALASRLDPGRFRVHLIAGRGGLLDAEAGRLGGVRLHFDDHLRREVRPFADARCLRSLRLRLLAIRRESPGPMIVHTHSSKAGILGRWAAYGAAADARVHSIHGFGFHGEQHPAVRRFYEGLEQLTARVTDAFCGDSQANLEVARALGLLEGGKPAIFLPPGIDTEEFVPRPGDELALRRELGLTATTPLVGMVACLKPQKAPLDFVRVAGRLAERSPAVHFCVAGDGVLRPAVEAEIRSLGLADRFHLLGWRRDMRQVFAALDVVVLTSIFEGLPRVLFQAMAAKKPIVATSVDGTPEAIEDGANGYLLRPHDLDGFRDRIAALLADGELARRMGEEGSRRVERFATSGVLRALVALYDRLLDKARSR